MRPAISRIRVCWPHRIGGATRKAIDGDKLTIKFAGNITKQIHADFVKPRKP